MSTSFKDSMWAGLLISVSMFIGAALMLIVQNEFLYETPTEALFWELKEKHGLYTFDEILETRQKEPGKAWINFSSFPGDKNVWLEVDQQDSLSGNPRLAERGFKVTKEKDEAVTYAGWIYTVVAVDSSYHEFTVPNRNK